jgi:FkbM family methyltransferase
MLQSIKKIVRPTYHRLRWLGRRLRNTVPSLPVSKHSYKLVRLGTTYGGWSFAEDADLHNSVIVSCGLGEDASFDVQIASRYGANLVIVDPTPRAIQHFDGIMSRVGSGAQQAYTTTGAQPIEAYDLRRISPSQLKLCRKALWNHNSALKFFAPRDPRHASHSIVNYQNEYATDTAHITVEAMTIDKLIEAYGINQIQLLKLDIEGAEIEVLTDMISKRIYPSQLLVEYDELSVPSRRARDRIANAHALLISSGYCLVHRETQNFTYIRTQ